MEYLLLINLVFILVLIVLVVYYSNREIKVNNSHKPTIFKVQMLYDTEPDEEDEDLFTECWLDMSRISGFLVPLNDNDEPMKDKVNIFFSDGEAQTFKAEKHVIKYLCRHFVDRAVKAK